MSKRRSPIDRFHEQYVTDDVTGCMIWTSARNDKGYGRFRDGVTRIVHRWSYQQFVGPIPDGLVIDHLCRVRSCVNPEHLRAVTSREHPRGRLGSNRSDVGGSDTLLQRP